MVRHYGNGWSHEKAAMVTDEWAAEDVERMRPELLVRASGTGKMTDMVRGGNLAGGRLSRPGPGLRRHSGPAVLRASGPGAPSGWPDPALPRRHAELSRSADASTAPPAIDALAATGHPASARPVAASGAVDSSGAKYERTPIREDPQQPDVASLGAVVPGVEGATGRGGSRRRAAGHCRGVLRRTPGGPAVRTLLRPRPLRCPPCVPRHAPRARGRARGRRARGLRHGPGQSPDTPGW